MARVNINGADTDLDGPDDTTLLWAIRDMAGLTGTKFGCGAGLCGACTVHVDGVATRSCLLTLADVEGAKVTTIEGLDAEGNHPVQVAWRDINVPQCGFCQAGQIMQAASLLSENPNPTDEEILEGMEGNIGRCGCYERITAAVKQAATGI
ncbi:MAG: (2Fe-2S)-binding protein [Pseudomonadota bacterium]